MSRLIDWLFQDWNANPHDLRIRLVLVGFRLANLIRRGGSFVRVLGFPYLVIYHILLVWFLHIELPARLKVGRGLRIYHGHCLVIHPSTIVSSNVTLRHCVTLGSSEKGGGAPTIQDEVDVGPHAVILGAITIGFKAVISAGSVVIKDVSPGSVVGGNPAKIIMSAQKRRDHQCLLP
jgi:putative colanic acid biosynthesis acetyltransferase WcaB